MNARWLCGRLLQQGPEKLLPFGAGFRAGIQPRTTLLALPLYHK